MNNKISVRCRQCATDYKWIINNEWWIISVENRLCDFPSLIFHYSIFISVATSLFITFCISYETIVRFRCQLNYLSTYSEIIFSLRFNELTTVVVMNWIFSMNCCYRNMNWIAFNAPQGAIHESQTQFMKSLISIRAVRQFIEFALQIHYNINIAILQS